jgi:protein-L-isoaspartate O-methyltransferase
MGLEVTAVDTPEALAVTRAALEAEGVRAVAGEPASPPVDGEFDLLISEGATFEIPRGWLDRLTPGGRAVFVLRGRAVGSAVVCRKTETATGARAAFDCFVPYLPGMAPQESFVF